MENKNSTSFDGGYYFSEPTITYEKSFEFTTNTSDGNDYSYCYTE